MVAKKLGKYNRALYILDGVRIQLDELELKAFHFRTFYRRFSYQMEMKMIYDTKQ